MNYKVIGQRVKRVEDPRLLTGQALFVGDVNLPEMLHAAFFRSDYAHAKLISIDTSQAERLPGVKAVTTGKDFNGFKWGWSRPTRDEEPLSTTKVRYMYELSLIHI